MPSIFYTNVVYLKPSIFFEDIYKEYFNYKSQKIRLSN